MLKWQQQHEGTDANAMGARGNRGGGRHQRWIVTVFGEMMLGEPHIVVAKFLGPNDLVEDRPIEFRIGSMPFARVTKILHQANLQHRRLQ